MFKGEVLVKITSVNVRKIEKENSRMKGIVSILIDDCFAVHDIKVIEGDNGLFVAMPSRRNAVGDYRDVAHPINQETREMFNQVILEEYEKAEDPVVETEENEEE